MRQEELVELAKIRGKIRAQVTRLEKSGINEYPIVVKVVKGLNGSISKINALIKKDKDRKNK